MYKLVKKVDGEKWQNYVENHPNGNIFQTLEMYQVFEKSKGYSPLIIGVIDNNESIVAILVAYIQEENSKLLKFISRRAVILGGPLIKDNNLEILKLVLSEFNSYVKRKAIYTQFRNLWEFTEEEKIIFSSYDFKYSPHLDILHDLSRNDSDIFAKFHKGRRKNIRRAERAGVIFDEVKNKKDLDDAVSTIRETYKKVSMPFPDESLFDSSFMILKDKNLCKFFVAKVNDKIIACRFVLCYNNLVYDWYAGNKPEYLDHYPNDFLPWKVMIWGANNNYKVFDFGGAGKPDIPYGVRDFKLKFGGNLVEFGRFEKVNQKIIYKVAKMGFLLIRDIKMKIFKMLRK